MFRTKLITLTCVAALALGISSKASADAIFDVTYTATQTGQSSTGGAIYDLDIGFAFTSGTCGGVAQLACDPFVDGLFNINVFLGVIVDVLSVDSLGGDWLEPEWGFFSGDGQVAYWLDFGLSDGVLPPVTDIELSMSFDNGAFEFLGLTDFDLLFSWGDGYVGTVNIDDIGSSVSTCPDFVCATVPEPGTLGLIGLGLFGLAARRRRIV